MKKMLICLFIFVTICVFGYTKDFAVSDFYVIENEYKISLGDSLKNKFNVNDLNSFKVCNLDNMKFKVFSFSWGEVYTPFSSDELTIFGLKLKNQDAKIIGDLRVGMPEELVLKKLGRPYLRKDDSLFYYNDDFDVLELKIILTNGIISEINLFMGT